MAIEIKRRGEAREKRGKEGGGKKRRRRRDTYVYSETLISYESGVNAYAKITLLDKKETGEKKEKKERSGGRDGGNKTGVNTTSVCTGGKFSARSVKIAF